MVPVLAVGAAPLVRRIGAGAAATAGCVFFGGGVVWWIVKLGATPDYVGGLLPGILLTGIGVGLTLPTLVSAAVSALPPQGFSTGSGVVTMARQVGSVLGVAMLVATLGRGDGALPPADAFDRGWSFMVATAVATAAVCLFIARSSRKVT
jgi:hypothetical protein